MHERMYTVSQRPLILAPAGSPEALYAALDAGVDEIYFGLWAHNARAGAKNFTPETARDAIRACRLRGVKTNITLNTLVTDRELPEALKLAYDAMCMGADAFIVQDLGLARALKKAMPEAVLHASTQCACHSASGARQLIDAGFSRVVLARELDREEITRIVSLGAETEIFVHGALCVCHSGMCLMSAAIGKRSGNRGMCAQPCRLPYSIRPAQKNSNRYPLSLKDLSLAGHVNTLTELGVTSLKIEGRMKPPMYVSGVTKLWKALVTENRGATREETAYLEALFSRSGFTDGYFTGAYRADNRAMYGVRTALDKQKTERLDASQTPPADRPAPRSRAVFMRASLRAGKPPVLEMRCADDETLCVRVTADFDVRNAEAQPLTEQAVCTALAKLGGTAFSCADIQIDLPDEVFLAKSQLNALRRSAVEALERRILTERSLPPWETVLHRLDGELPDGKTAPCRKESRKASARTAKEQPSGFRAIPLRLYPANADEVEKMLGQYSAYPLESICLPLGMFSQGVPALAENLRERGIPFGVRMPRVVFDREETYAMQALAAAKASGASYGVAENIGQLSLVCEAGLALYGGAGLNVFNSLCLAQLAEYGAESVTLSPELLTAQMRDLRRPAHMSTARLAAGRLELMVLESCVVKAGGACRKAENGGECAQLCDRTGAAFPLRTERRLGPEPFPCRQVLLNSVPLRLLDKPEETEKSGVQVCCVYGG